MAVPSQLVLSEEGYHWFDVGFPPDVFILYVVLLCLVSSQSQHSHLSGVQFYYMEEAWYHSNIQVVMCIFMVLL